MSWILLGGTVQFVSEVVSLRSSMVQYSAGEVGAQGEVRVSQTLQHNDNRKSGNSAKHPNCLHATPFTIGVVACTTPPTSSAPPPPMRIVCWNIVSEHTASFRVDGIT